MRRLLTVIVLLVTSVFFMIPACAESGWVCPECGREGNTGAFCGNCAHPSPSPDDFARKNWSVSDILLLQKYLAGWDVTIVTKAYDVNNDGTVNIADVLTIQKILMHWDT